jgi:hypothetical protein
MTLHNISKTKKLALSLVFDALGYVSFVFPPFDFIWAPASAWLMTKLYKGRKGKIAAAISFVEEALPMLDIIPTFTLMWLYTFVFSSKNSSSASILE